MSEIRESVYRLLPRFLTEADLDPKVSKEVRFPSVSRRFEWNNTEFDLIISPAVISENGISNYYYPQERERKLEDALFGLIEVGNGFDKETGTVKFALRELVSEVDKPSSEIDLEATDLVLGIKILSKINYELVDGRSEYCFRPIEKMLFDQSDGEYYFHIQFAKFFLGDMKYFNLCFGN